MKMGVRVPPRPRPALCNPLAKPLSLTLVHEAITRTQLGETAASPTPVKNRMAWKANKTLIPVLTAKRGATPISPAPAPKHSIDAVSVRMGPRRSQMYPHGIWKSAYPHRKELKMPPIWMVSSANSCSRVLPAILKFRRFNAVTAMINMTMLMTYQRTAVGALEFVEPFAARVCLSALLTRFKACVTPVLQTASALLKNSASPVVSFEHTTTWARVNEYARTNTHKRANKYVVLGQRGSNSEHRESCCSCTRGASKIAQGREARLLRLPSESTLTTIASD